MASFRAKEFAHFVPIGLGMVELSEGLRDVIVSELDKKRTHIRVFVFCNRASLKEYPR